MKDVIEANSGKPVCAWLDVDAEKGQATVIRLPAREEIDFEVEEHLIVELYSK